MGYREIDTIEGYRNAAINKLKAGDLTHQELNITFRNYANTFTNNYESKNIIIGGITLAILTLILLAIMFIQPAHTISITFDKENLSAIYRNTGKSTSKLRR